MKTVQIIYDPETNLCYEDMHILLHIALHCTSIDRYEADSFIASSFRFKAYIEIGL